MERAIIGQKTYPAIKVKDIKDGMFIAASDGGDCWMLFEVKNQTLVNSTHKVDLDVNLTPRSGFFQVDQELWDRHTAE